MRPSDGEPASRAPSARHPVPLPANFVARFYRGGARLGAFRRQAAGEFDGEDWVGSTTAAYGGTDGLGLSRLAGGRPLAVVLAEDPVGFLGAEHVAAFGTGTELLVKLLDAGERLAVHYHPARAFARRHLGCAHGKTEAWLILQAPDDAAVHLGFREPVSTGQAAAWSREQDTAALLAALNRVPVRAGDALLVPSGVPHAIGAGLFLVELQEPADWSLMLERVDAGSADPEDWHLGLGGELALSALDRSAWDPARLAGLRLPAPEPLAPGRARLLPALGAPYFRAELLTGGAVLETAFGVVVTDGTLTLTDASGTVTPVTAGETWLLPHGAGPITVAGPGRAVRCLPPRPEDVAAGA